jgi:hypothetical protein
MHKFLPKQGGPTSTSDQPIVTIEEFRVTWEESSLQTDIDVYHIGAKFIHRPESNEFLKNVWSI